jgi:hypothetical protein
LHEKESQLSHLENLSESEKVLKRNQIENLQSELDKILADIKHEVSNLVTFNDILNCVKLQYCIGKNPVDLSSRLRCLTFFVIVLEELLKMSAKHKVVFFFVLNLIYLSNYSQEEIGDRLSEDFSNRDTILLSNMSSGQLLQCHLNQLEV